MMVQRIDDLRPDEGAAFDSSDDDERVGEAIETYLALAEQGKPPAIEEFAARYPDLKDDVHAALEGLELVHGLLGLGSAAGSGSGNGSAADRRIESGRRIAGYRVVGELGRGGMGTVYEALHMGLDRPVALKVLGVHAAPDSSARRRFLNEARTAAGLHHTHIVPVFDVGQVGGLCYYAMQRIEGSGLDRVVRHLRRTRQLGDGGGACGSGASTGLGGSRLPDIQGASGTSLANARLGRLWLRISSRWPWRQAGSLGSNPGGEGPGKTDPASSSAQHDAVSRLLSFPGLGDSTASWDTGGRRAAEKERRDGGGPIPSGPASLATFAEIDRASRRREDEPPPPFDTPRGSAYFRWVATVGFQAADALAHAHHEGVIHRDVKPSNLLVDAKGNIWVTDFGLARRLADPGLTHHDSLLGTPRYMSPEQARTGSIDGRTDVYSLGATLYELLALRPPFDGQTAAELFDQIGQDEPIPPRAFDPRIPLDLETIVLKALAKRPADRYATAADLAEDLTRFLNREPVRARRISPMGRLWRVARRHPGITCVSTAAAASILTIATYAYIRVDGERQLAQTERDKAKQALTAFEKASSEKFAEMKRGLVSAVELVEKSDVPKRRSQGLDLIRKTVALNPDAAQRSTLRDLAMRFLVLREVKAHDSDLATGRAHGLAFGPSGHRLAVLSEDNEELALWDVARRQRLSTVSLRGDVGSLGSQATRQTSEPGSAESSGDRVEPGPAALTNPASSSGRNGPVAPASSARPPWLLGRRLASTGQYLAAVMADNRGVRLIDIASGTLLHAVHRPDRSQVVSVLADPAGFRLVTIESIALPDDLAAAMEAAGDFVDSRGEFQVNLWNPDHLDEPITLRFGNRPGGPQGRSTTTIPGRSGLPPLVAISPDGKTVAVSPSRGGMVRLFSGDDGNELRNGRIEAQPELTTLALGPDALLATAGGGTVRLWDLDRDSRSFQTLSPAQSFTRQMRFSPQGDLLAIAGLGTVELWDPVAHTLVAVLKTPEQVGDLAFAPDGRTMAVVDRSGATSLWTVIDSATRTQLGALDSQPTSLAFSDDGILVGGGSNGNVWFWRKGRCPEVSSPLPLATPNDARPTAPSGRHGPGPLPPATNQPGRIAVQGTGSGAASSTSMASPPTNSLSNVDPPRLPGPPATDRGRGGPMGRPDRPRDWEREFRHTTLAFDSNGRLVTHDMRGLRIWPAGTVSAQNPPTLEYKLAPPTRRPGMNFMPMAKAADGRIMVLVRSSSVFLWHADAPDHFVKVIPPPRSVAETTQPAGVNSPRRGTTLGADIPLLPFHAVQISPRGDRIYLIDQRGRLHVWALESPSEADPSPVQARDLDWNVPVAEGGFTNLALRNDGLILALGDRTQTVTLLNTSNQAILNRIRPANGEGEGFWLALAFSPDGRELAAGSESGTISLWSVAQPSRPRLRFRLPGHRGITTNLVFDTQGRQLASVGATEALVEVWDLELIQRELARLELAD